MITLQQQFELQPHNCLRLQSRAAHYGSAADIASLQAAIDYARQKKLSLLPLGEGSNVVLDQLPNTLVVDIALRGIALLSESDSEVLVEVAAGENWQQWICRCLAEGWHGLENLALIPGRVGAAPIQNIGAYGSEVGDYIESVKILRRDDGGAQTLSREDCQFGYRNSIFKCQLGEKVIITAVSFRLQKHYRPQLSHPALCNYFDTEQLPSASEMVAAVTKIRRDKLPDPAQTANVGSFFKNPKIAAEQFAALSSRHPDMPYYHSASDDLYKIPAAWLIEHCGYRGKRCGNLGMHDRQALVLVNYDDGERASCASEVLAFAAEVNAAVKKCFGLSLEIEPLCYP